jgi:hypothetical protein
MALVGIHDQETKDLLHGLLSLPSWDVLVPYQEVVEGIHHQAMDACHRGASRVVTWSPHEMPPQLRTLSYKYHHNVIERELFLDAVARPTVIHDLRSDVRHVFYLSTSVFEAIPANLVQESITKVLSLSGFGNVSVRLVLPNSFLPQAFAYYMFPKGVNCVYQEGYPTGVFSSNKKTLDRYNRYLSRVFRSSALSAMDSRKYLRNMWKGMYVNQKGITK